MSISVTTAGPLSEQQVQAYHREGFVVVPALYPPQELLRWKDVLKKLVADESAALKSGVRVWKYESFPTQLLESMREPNVVAMLRQLVGPNVEFLSAKAVFKNASTRFASLWHQDWFYWGGSNKVSVWIALDDATVANGCLKFVPGTHKGVMRKQSVSDDNPFSQRIHDADIAGMEQRTIECKRGDAVFFHDLAVHSSHPNTSGGDRWSFISTYRDASVKDDAQVWPTSLVVSGASVNAGAQS